MERSTSRFLMGLGAGSLLGAIIGYLVQTEKAKCWRKKMCCAAHSAMDKACECMCNIKENASGMEHSVGESVVDDTKK